MQSSTKPATHLFLLRHGHSGWPRTGQKDFDRELDDRGRAECSDIARQALNYGYVPTAVVSSPAERCRQTVALFLEGQSSAGREQPEVRYDRTLYDADVAPYLATADEIAAGESLLLAGHNPMIERTFEMLANGDRRAVEWLEAGYPTAGFAVFSRDHDGPWRLEALLAP